MALYMDTYVRAIQGRLQEVRGEDAELGAEDLREAVEQAVREHSQFAPQVKVSDIACTDDYDVTLPSDWVKDFSVIESVEYPQGDQDPAYIEPKEWILYQGTSGNPTLRFVSAEVESGETLRLTYVIPHSVTDSATTIPETDFWALANLAASYAARVMAAKYTRTWSPSLDVDVINYRVRAQDWINLAQKCEAIWQVHMGVPEKGGPPPASTQGDWDMTYSWGRSLLVHKPKWR